MFFVILFGISLVAVGIGSTFGGGWATVGAVVLLAIGLKVLFMAVMFAFFGRRFRAMRRQEWASDEGGRPGWPCGRNHGPESMRTRMQEWHQMAHAATAGGSPADDTAAE